MPRSGCAARVFPLGEDVPECADVHILGGNVGRGANCAAEGKAVLII